MIQDGWEYWIEKTKVKAIQSMISFARLMNGSYITEKEISYKETLDRKESLESISLEDRVLLDKIKSRHLVVLAHDDPRIKFGISPEDCQLIVDIREGRVTIRREHE